MDFNLDLLIYYFTSINQYSFVFLIFLFLISFLMNSEKISYIVPLRILFGFLIIIFYFIGWTDIKFDKYQNNMFGKKIPENTKLLKVCPMQKVNDYFDRAIYNYEIAAKYSCALEREDLYRLKYHKGYNLLIKNKIIQQIIATKNFSVVGTLRVSSSGLLNPNNYYILVIQDSKKNIYIASKSILQRIKR